jgi:cysteine-rich repeat protein
MSCRDIADPKIILEMCAQICGTGMTLNSSKECDDGNSDDGDGCSSDCRVEVDFICSQGIPGYKSFCMNPKLLGPVPKLQQVNNSGTAAVVEIVFTSPIEYVALKPGENALLYYNGVEYIDGSKIKIEWINLLITITTEEATSVIDSLEVRFLDVCAVKDLNNRCLVKSEASLDISSSNPLTLYGGLSKSLEKFGDTIYGNADFTLYSLICTVISFNFHPRIFSYFLVIFLEGTLGI